MSHGLIDTISYDLMDIICVWNLWRARRIFLTR